MDFRTILTFIVIAFLSSLFNKNKTPTKPRVDTGKPTSQDSPSSGKASGPDENKRKKISGGLEELFKEMKSEFEKTLKEPQEKKQTHFPMEQDTKGEDNTVVERDSRSLGGALKRDIRKAAGSVYEGEIGKEAYIKFNRKSIIQGVIMSEILQKPKSLKR